MGKKIATDLIRNHANVLALTGELGSGKTTFVQGLAEGLGIKQRIISPTFILVRKYEIPISNIQYQISNFYHIDLYRLEENVETEVRNLGLEEIWQNPENIVVIEWAEKIKSMIPKKARWIEFKNNGGNNRQITIY